mgnify:CR=1 FL=1
MTDPYKVLGVPTTATDDEVKAAYRRLAKRYHPDANPGDRTAEQRMKEINAAYDQIMNKDEGPSFGGSANRGYGPYANRDPFGGYDPFGSSGGFGGEYSGRSAQNGDPRMDAARNYLNFRRYREALNVLESIAERDARWYYYSAIANLNLGNAMAALHNARRAVELEPDNPEYNALLERIENPSRAYAGYGQGFGGVSGAGVSRLCAGLVLSQLFCFYLRFCCR